MGLRSQVALFSFLVFASGCSHAPKAEPPLTPEGKAYVRSLALTDTSMKASDSYAQQTLTEIEGKIQNTGNKSVDRVDVFCNFFDQNGILILKERGALVKRALKPGEIRKFRLAFDDIPQSWNNQMPSFVIAQVIFS